MPISRRLMLRTGAASAGVLATAGIPDAAVAGASPAELSFPATPLTRRAVRLAERHEPQFLVNHSLRSYLFGVAVAGRAGLRPGRDFNPELLFLICILHDLGLTEVANGDQRFEVDGADFAADFLEQNGAPSDWVDTAWDAIALHTTPSVVASPTFRRRRPPEVGISVDGIAIDIIGRPDQLPPGYADRVLAVYPRLGGARALTEVMLAQAIANPDKAPPLTFPGEVLHQRLPSAPYPTWDDLLAAAGWGD